MKIVNKTKFVRTISVFIILLGLILIFSKNTYSKGEITYKEDYIYAGDTLWNIAKRFRVSMQEIIKLNGLENPDRINIGDVLYIMR